MPRIRATDIPTHKALTREAILDAAEESVGRFGYEGTSLSVISDLSELPRSSIYEYFSNRDDVLVALIAERVAPLVEEWFRALPEAPAMSRVEAMFVSAFEMAATHPAYAGLMLEANRRLPREVRERHFPQVVAVTDDLVATCSSAMADGSFADGDAAGLAGVLSSLLVTGVEDLVAHPEPAGRVPETLDTRLRVLKHGVAGRESGRPSRTSRDKVRSLGLQAG